jgi:hypothetical protein
MSDDIAEAARAGLRGKARGKTRTNGHAVPSSMQLAEFLAASSPPQFLIEPMLQRGFLYTLTAKTFHGKTSVLIYTLLCVAKRSMSFAGKHTEHGRVVLFAGENPDDTANKFLVACEYWGLDPAELPITVIPGAFDLAGNVDAALFEAGSGGSVAAVGIDTSAAYRFDDDEDDNQRSKAWAQQLRRFVDLPGRPAVVVSTHPIKHAERPSQLLPRGGGGFLNEVDGNLTLWADLDAGFTDLHWTGKLRGPSFNPIRFNLTDHPHPTWSYHDCTAVQMKVATPDQSGATATASSKRRNGPRLSPTEQIGLRILEEAMSQTDVKATVFDDPDVAGLVVREEDWRAKFYRDGMPATDKSNTKEKAFRRAAFGLSAKNVIKTRDGFVWPL